MIDFDASDDNMQFYVGNTELIRIYPKTGRIFVRLEECKNGIDGEKSIGRSVRIWCRK